jgi:hypothetical protein
MNKSIIFTQGEYGHYRSNFGRNLAICICCILVTIVVFLACFSLPGCGGDTKFDDYSSYGTYQGKAFVFYPDDPNYVGTIRYPVIGSGVYKSSAFDASKCQQFFRYFWHELPDTGSLLPICWSGFGYVQFYDDGKPIGPIDHESPAMWPEEDSPDEPEN